MLHYLVKHQLLNGWCPKMVSFLDSFIVNGKVPQGSTFSLSTEGRVTIPFLNIILNLLNGTLCVRKGKELIIPESMNLGDVTMYELIEDQHFSEKFLELCKSGDEFSFLCIDSTVLTTNHGQPSRIHLEWST